MFLGLFDCMGWFEFGFVVFVVEFLKVLNRIEVIEWFIVVVMSWVRIVLLVLMSVLVMSSSVFDSM